MNDIATDVAAAIHKRADQFSPVASSDPKRTRNELQRDSALQFVSLSQSLT